MERKKPEIRYSEPVEDIMGSPPKSILRWGTTVIFLVFVLFIVFAWLFRYPDIVPSPVEITTENPPVVMVSRVDGRIKHLFASDRDTVKRGQVIAVTETAADYNEFLILKSFMDTVKISPGLKESNLPALSELGELQDYYSTFRKSLADLDNFISANYYGNRINSIEEEISGIRKYISALRIKERISSENLALQIKGFSRDSLLRTNTSSVSDADLERSRKELNDEKIALQTVRLEIAGRELEIVNKRQQIIELSSQLEEELSRKSTTLDESYSNLKARIGIWEMTYLLVSPVDGTITFTSYWKENQTVKAGEQVLAVVPADQGKFIGRVSLRMAMSGKVDTGQSVYIKLSSFPYLEYGMLKGEIKTKSLVPESDTYMLEIVLPDSLETLYGRSLMFTQNMKGTAEIITEDRSLLEKIISPFRYLQSRNRRP